MLMLRLRSARPAALLLIVGESMLNKTTYLVVLLLLGCEPLPEAPAPALPAQVGVLRLQASDALLQVELSGRVSAYRVSEVRPQVSGLIQQRLFQEGAEVKAGQLLYRIDAGRYQAAVELAEANLSNARASLDSLRSRALRYAELIKIEGVSRQELEDAQAALRQGQASVQAGLAALKAARVDMQHTRIRAPIAGRIGRSLSTEGALVSDGQSAPLATIQQLDPIYVDVVQSSRELLELKRRRDQGGLQAASSRVTLRLEDGQAYAHAGVMQFSEVSVDAATGAVTLRAQFANPDGLLLPGMFVRAEVEQGLVRDAILVPQQGVRHNARSEPVALVVDADNVVQERRLTTLGSRGNQWLVGAGLQPGERLIVDGLQRAVPGQPVTPVELPAGTPLASSSIR